MKLVLKALGILILLPILYLAAVLGWDIVFPKKYVNGLATESVLKEHEKRYLIDLFGKKNDESIVYVTTTKSTLEEGGAILTTKRLIAFLEGQDSSSADIIDVKEISGVEMIKSDSWLTPSFIKVMKDDSSKFAFGVGVANQVDEIFYEKVRSIAKLK